MASEMTNIIKNNDYVIMKRENDIKAFKVNLKRKIYIDKVQLLIGGIIGHPYGSTFEVKDGQMVKLDKSETETAAITNEKGSEKDNRNLQDSDSNQKLSREEIEQMKQDGASREHLINQLIENSTTFQEKTEYSQEKWVKKKKKKHLLVFTVLRPNSRLRCQYKCSDTRQKICNIRVDTLAQILTHGNIRAGMTVMVVDTCNWLVIGAVLERLGGFGRLINFFPGDKPKRQFLEEYNFSKEITDTLLDFPLKRLNSLKEKLNESTVTQPSTTSMMNQSTNESCETQSDIKSSVAQSANSSETQSTEKSSAAQSANSSEAQSTETAPVTESSPGEKRKRPWNTRKEKRAFFKQKKKDKRDEAGKAAEDHLEQNIEDTKKILLEKNVDCLIVASKFHPTPIVKALSEYLAPSRQVVVFSEFMEAIEDCYIHLRENGDMINFRTTETWLREYQVLPNRTHPVINMSGTGGYLLVATKVIKSD